MSITRCTYPAAAQASRSCANPRPPPYPMSSTTAGRSPVAPAGRVTQALIGCPPNPANVTSNASMTVSPESTGVTVSARSNVRASASVVAQNSSKSSGSSSTGR